MTRSDYLKIIVIIPIMFIGTLISAGLVNKWEMEASNKKANIEALQRYSKDLEEELLKTVKERDGAAHQRDVCVDMLIKRCTCK